MKALQKSPISPERAFEFRFLKEPHFDPNWHFHPEYQLFVVLKGTGTRFIGDHVQPFQAGDLVLTGPDLPHLWRSDPEYFDGDPSLWTEGIVAYFPADFFGSSLFAKMEMLEIRQLLARSIRGLSFHGRAADAVRDMLRELVGKKDFDSVLQVLMILQRLAASSDYTVLANPGYVNSLKEADTERMNRVHAFIMKNFREKIGLNDVAALASMAPSSFSRYFRVHTNKTFSEFLTGIRIGYACKLLIEKDMSVAQACYDSGFHTLSNFNRQFRAITRCTPLEYRRRLGGRDN